MATAEQTSDLIERQSARFGEIKSDLPGDGLSWLTGRREAGMERFAELGWPTPKLEDWKFTTLRPLEKAGVADAGEPEAPAIDRVPALMAAGAYAARAVVVNGRFHPELSDLADLPAGVTVAGLAEMLKSDPATLEPHLCQVADSEDQALLALNDALFRDGVVVRVPRGTVVEKPIEIVKLSTADAAPGAYHARQLVILEPESAATIVQNDAGFGETPVFANWASEIVVGQGARLCRYQAQTAPQSIYQTCTEHLRQDRDAKLDSMTLTIGNRLTRNETRIALAGENAECRFNGVYLQRNRQHCDTTSVITHSVPHTRCRQVFKGALDDKARAVFQGRIEVKPDAQKTDGRMMNKTLLLSGSAEIDTKPELEIFADDVQCAHGATAGEIDHDALFYLRSRGIPDARARRLLVKAFLAEVVEEIEDPALREVFLERLDGWLDTSVSEEQA